MTEQDIVRSIRKSWAYIQAVGVDQLFTVPSPLQPSDEFKELARGQASYEEVYLGGLAGGQYNILIADYAFLQFGGRDDDSLRYAFYPNPFLGASREAIASLAELRSFVDEGVVDMDEFLHGVSEIRQTQHPPLMRYENSSSQYVALTHPCSHLHLGHHSENRWPVRRVLTPAAFTLLILKHFYSDYWAEGSMIQRGRKRISLDEALMADKQECRLLPDDLFCADERRHFFFG